MNEPPTPPPPPATRPDTRADLLDAARRCVREHGLAGATSREITSAARANLASITYHFGSKDALIAEALFSEIERRVRPALDAFARPGAAADALLGVVAQLLTELEASQDDAVVYLEALLMATRDPAYRARALELTSSLGTRLADVVHDLQATGIVPTWVDPPAMSSLILAIANGIVLQSRLDPAGPDAAGMATQFAGLLLAAARHP